MAELTKNPNIQGEIEADGDGTTVSVDKDYQGRLWRTAKIGSSPPYDLETRFPIPDASQEEFDEDVQGRILAALPYAGIALCRLLLSHPQMADHTLRLAERSEELPDAHKRVSVATALLQNRLDLLQQLEAQDIEIRELRNAVRELTEDQHTLAAALKNLTSALGVLPTSREATQE